MDVVAVSAAGRLAAPAVAAGGKGICKWLKRKYDYVKHVDRNFEKLEKVKEDLIDKQNGVKTELHRNRSTMERTPECDTWLKRVERKIREIEAVEHDYRNKPCTCFCGLCPYCALHDLGKSIMTKTAEATALKDELSTINRMRELDKRVPHSDRWSNDVRIVNHSSLEKHVVKLLEWLEDESMKRICIWGPPGVGKTTIMKVLRDKVRASSQFDHTFITLTAESRIEDIQKVIGHSLGMRVDENNDPLQKAEEISARPDYKRYVLFLDEVPSATNILEEVWNHFDNNNNNNRQVKVVFACREKYPGQTDEDRNVQPLSKEDARMLFWDVVGSDLERRGEIKRIAEKIIDLCGGMPPVLMLVGKELAKKNDPALWREMKTRLQSPSSQPWEKWEEYYRSFELVFNNLPDDVQKLCLLYWAIFPFGEEINQDYIIDCWIAEKFLQHERLHATRDKGVKFLVEFEDKLLVGKGEKLGHFKMFDCFQYAAYRKANLQNNIKFFAANGRELNNEEWREANRVSLARVHPIQLPSSPQCRGLLTLFFQENDFQEFPTKFFKFMTDLQVLGLNKTGITTLPSSLSSLQNLKGLFLNNGSQFVQLPRQIGALGNLEILDVTGIYSLPREIRRLKNLKSLRVSFKNAGNQNHVNNNGNGANEQIIPGEVAGNQNHARIPCFGNCNGCGANEKMIPGKTIAKLSNLEELSLDVSDDMRRWNENADAIAREIIKLEHLTHLHFYFTNLDSFRNFIENNKSWKANDRAREFVGFRSFRIFVGEQRNCSESDFNVFECSAEKHLNFSEGVEFPAAVSEVLEQAKSFELIGHSTARNLTEDPFADKLQELEVCIVKECNAMQSIVNGNPTTTGGVVFQCLEKLHIRKLPNLVRIWEGPIASESFRALTSLTIKECGTIQILFSLEMVRQLPRLQNLQVEDCRMIEKIIDADSTVQSVAFPKLKNFLLCSLTNLPSICDASLDWPFLETIMIKTCVLLQSLPRILLQAPRLREIQCTEDLLQGQHWPNNETKEHFRNLRRDPNPS
ncbi:hypothetical protein REPUB_Repub20aG0022600 [Reevesia pubescens]